MFTKVKNLFKKDNPEAQITMDTQFDHSQIDTKNAAKCPFAGKSSKPNHQTEQKCPVSGKAVPSAEVDSDSQEEKPRGGCPFMNGTSDKKKNPNLNLTEEGYDEPFVSKFKFYLSGNKLDFPGIRQGLPRTQVVRQLFNSYPIYLQHTLFFNGEDYKKVRGIQCCSRFMAYEQLRQKGNKYYNKGKYHEALDYYERAMSLFRWLEYSEHSSGASTEHSERLSQLSSSEDVSENGSHVNIAVEPPQPENPADVFQELRGKYKEFFTTYGDDNTKLCDGEQMIQDADIDMRKSLLIQIYMNMCAAYIQLHHYSLAEKVCNDGLGLSDKVSQLYFRKAQALSLQKSATIQQLKIAKECITIAIERRPTQKIFSTANQNILKMLNIHNSEESYEACRKHIQQRLAQVNEVNASNYARIYDRVKQIHQNEQRIIAEGRVPQENRDDKLLEDNLSMKIMNRIAAKYIKVIEFYTEAKNHEQIMLAKKQFQEVLKAAHEVKSLFAVQLKEKDQQLGGLHSEKVQHRVNYVKTNFAEEIHNAARFNFTMLQWVIKEIVKEENEEKKKKLQAQKKAKEESMAMNGESVKQGNGKLSYILVILPIILIMLGMFAS